MYFCQCDWKSVSGAVWLAASDEPWTCGGHPDEHGTWTERMARVSALFVEAMGSEEAKAVAAWDQLFEQEAAGGVEVYRELVKTTRSWRVRGRAVMALCRLINDYAAARDRLGATIKNSDDETAKREAAQFLGEIAG